MQHTAHNWMNSPQTLCDDTLTTSRQRTNQRVTTSSTTCGCNRMARVTLLPQPSNSTSSWLLPAGYPTTT